MKHLRKYMGKTFLLGIVTLLALLPSGCSTPSANEAQEFNGIYFDTVIQVRAWGADSETMEHCRELCEFYEGLFSRTLEDSEVSSINASHGEPVTVSPETAELISLGLTYAELSGGAFDITIAPVSELWDFKDNEDGVLPEASDIEAARAHVNYKNVKLEGNTVTLLDPNVQIDLGGIAKGYIADQLKNYLESQGIEHALINLGGNVLALGSRPDGTPFRIGIQKPFAEQNEALTELDVNDQSVVSSGIYERYFEKDGIIYHHILDPATGYPCENDLLQVTILSDSSADGDALSTACFVLGQEEGEKLIESLDGIEAIFVTEEAVTPTY